MTAKPDFRRGVEAAEAASKSGGAFARTEYFRIEDGEETHLRFLTEANPDADGNGGWISVLQHQMVPTKPQPDGFEGKWPTRMPAVCRNDPAFTDIYDDCYICEALVDGDSLRNPSARDWALACVREEIIGDGSEELGGAEYKGQVIGMSDALREIEIPVRDGDGNTTGQTKKITEKKVVVVNQGYKNFFSVLAGFAGKYGTMLDRDYWIKRNGSGTDTTYQIVPVDPIKLEDGSVFDLRNPEHAKRYENEDNPISLGEVVTQRSSDEYYARFFDPRFTVKDGNVVESGVAVADQAKPSGDVPQAQLDAVVSRIRNIKEYTQEEAKEQAEQSSPGAMRNFD